MAEHPGVIYKVFIAVPNSAKREYVGSLSFFRNPNPMDRHHGQTAGMVRSLDITKALVRLGESPD